MPKGSPEADDGLYDNKRIPAGFKTPWNTSQNDGNTPHRGTNRGGEGKVGS